MTTGIYNFPSFIFKTILFKSTLALLFLLPVTEKTQSFVHLSFNSTLQLINDILIDLQKLFRYFNDPEIYLDLEHVEQLCLH